MARGRLAVLISGSGTNFRAIHQAIGRGEVPADIVLVVADNSKAKGLDYAKSEGIPTVVLRPKDFESLDQWDQKLLDVLTKARSDLVILAGFLKKIGPKVLKAFPDRILNIHPALLPKYGGKGCYGIRPHEMAIENGDRYAGATVHFVNEKYDDGAIVLQEKLVIRPGETAAELQQRVLEQIEWTIYPKAIAQVLKERLTCEEH